MDRRRGSAGWWAERLGESTTLGPLALVGWFPLTVAGLLLLGAIIGRSWVPVLFAAVIVVIRLAFAWLERLARVPVHDPDPVKGDPEKGRAEKGDPGNDRR